MNKLDPKLVTVITVVAVVIALFVIYKTTIGNRITTAPPIAAAGMETGHLTLPGKDTAGAATGAMGASVGGPQGGMAPGGMAPGMAPGGMAPGMAPGAPPGR